MALDFGNFLPSIIEGFSGLTMMSQGADLAQQGAAYSAASYRTAGSMGISGAQYQADTLRIAGDIAVQGANYEKQVIQQAKKINTEGAQYQSSVLVNAGQAAIQAARYNKSLDAADTAKTLDVMGRQIKQTYSANNAIISRTGLSPTSKSYLMVMNDAMSKYEEQTVGVRSAAILRQQEILHKGNLEAVQYLNQANAVLYSSKIANYNYDTQATAAEYQAQIAKYNYNNQATAAEYEGQVAAYQYEAQARQAEYQGQIAAYNAEVGQAKAIGGMIGQLGSLF